MRRRSRLGRTAGEFVQIVLPFYGEQILLARVAVFAAGHHVGLAGRPAASQWHHVIHCQFPRGNLSPAIMAYTAAPQVLPPLALTQFAGLRLFPAQMAFFRQCVARHEGTVIGWGGVPWET